MEKRPFAALRRLALTAGLGPIVVGLLVLLAHRALLVAPPSVDVDSLVFLPGRLPVGLVIGLALWLLWQRRGPWLPRQDPASRPRTTSGRSPIRAVWRQTPALLLALLGTALFIWSMLTGKTDLLLPSLAAHALALAVATRGLRGLRAGLLPALALLLGLQIPKPLEDEIVWQLQVWTAKASGRLLTALGRDFEQSGVILRNDEHVFHVIDSCSGLNGILILVLIALIVRELFRSEAAHRTWLLLAAAPVLGFVLNVFRVAYVAASPEPEKLAGVGGDHTLQGITVLMAGTLLLYGLGWALAATTARSGNAPQQRPEPSAGADLRAGSEESPARGHRGSPSGTLCRSALIVWLVGLVGASFALPRFPAPDLASRRVAPTIPESKSGWTSERAPQDLLFTGVFSSGLHRRYHFDLGPGRPPEIVDVLIGYEDVTRPQATRLISSKGAVPGPEWELESRQPTRIWLLDRDAELALSSRPADGRSALAYVLRPRDLGLARETIRSLLALDLGPWRRDRPRGLIRLTAYAPHDGRLALDQARQRLDRFIRVFREDLDRP